MRPFIWLSVQWEQLQRWLMSHPVYTFSIMVNLLFCCEHWKTAEWVNYSCVVLHQPGSRLGGALPGKWNYKACYNSIVCNESWLCDMWASRQKTGFMITWFLLKRQQNWTTAKEIINVLFIYTMIHKLDLYINIAFHPNDQKYYTFN